MIQKRKIQLFQKLVVTKLDTSVGRLLVPEYLPIISQCFGTNMMY